MAVNMETRNDRIKAFLKSGKTIAEAATKFELSKARIWKVANDFKEAPRNAKPNGKRKAHGKATKTVARKFVKHPARGAKSKTPRTAKQLGITKAQSARKSAAKKDKGAGVTSSAPAGKLSDAAASVQG